MECDSPFALRIVNGFFLLVALCLCALVAPHSVAQIETIDSPTPAQFSWSSQGRVEGHLALNYSPAGAFSPDSSSLAVIVDNKILLMDLRAGDVRKTLRPRLEDVRDLTIHSANFVAPDQLFLLANGIFQAKGKGVGVPTPTIGFLWDPNLDELVGKVNAIGASGGYGPVRFFPLLGYVGLYKDSSFDLWNPLTGHGGRLTIAALTRQPNLFEFSPDARWLLLAQLEASGATDPIVVDVDARKFVDSLRGHVGTVLSMIFSRDSRRIVTACEDGKVRVWSVPDWKLLQTLTGHQGPVHWAEFSADGKWVASGGQDKRVCIWSTQDGLLIQTLEEASSPIRTVAFSPNGEFLAASAEDRVWIWRLTRQ